MKKNVAAKLFDYNFSFLDLHLKSHRFTNVPTLKNAWVIYLLNFTLNPLTLPSSFVSLSTFSFCFYLFFYLLLFLSFPDLLLYQIIQMWPLAPSRQTTKLFNNKLITNCIIFQSMFFSAYIWLPKIVSPNIFLVFYA